MKILEISYMDLPGKRFNGYDLIEDLNDHDIKQVVLDKYSKNDNVICLFNNAKEYYLYLKLLEIETKNSLQGVFSITSPIILDSNIYKDSDKIHIHSLANCKMSLYSLLKISKEKDLILSFHDPWYLTGRCVHFFECNKWKTGCLNCSNLNTHYPMKKDNCNMLWEMKKNVFNCIEPKIIFPSEWMMNLIKTSPIMKTQKNLNMIPFGIDVNKFTKRKINKKEYDINEDQIVLFFRAEKNFKGTEFIVEALKKVENKDKITILTCGQEGLLKDIEKDYKIKEFGFINEETLIDIFSITDIFLMPSTGETFGLMGIEAMACECPIVVFENTALENIVESPNCGLSAKYKNSNSLYEKIMFLVNNKEERVIRGKQGRKIVENKYNANEYLKKINLIYKNNYKKDNIEYKIESSSNDALLTQLNNISKEIFSKNPKVFEKIEFDCKYSEINIDYSDISIQKRIYEYCEMLYKLTKTEKFHVPNIVKIKFWFKKHRNLQRLIKKVLRK